MIRINFFGTFFGNPYPSRLHIIAYASLLLGCSMIVLYFFYNSLGNLMGIIGAAFGFILVYIIPIVINIIYYRRKHPPKKVLLDHENLNSDDEISQEQEELQIDGKENRKESLDLKDQFIFTGKKRNYVKDCCFYITMYIIIALGLITLVFQFVYVNIFNIQIRSA